VCVYVHFYSCDVAKCIYISKYDDRSKSTKKSHVYMISNMSYVC
jgi:hypothetical protein